MLAASDKIPTASAGQLCKNMAKYGQNVSALFLRASLDITKNRVNNLNHNCRDLITTCLYKKQTEQRDSITKILKVFSHFSHY